jgi:hypothetical protein
VLRYQGSDATTGELKTVERRVCDEHYDDLISQITPCGNDQCGNLARHVIPITWGNGVEDELPVCGRCRDEYLRAPMVTINGVRMIKSGSRLKAVPDEIGRG